jgi:hypothetical protein
MKDLGRSYWIPELALKFSMRIRPIEHSLSSHAVGELNGGIVVLQ